MQRWGSVWLGIFPLKSAAGLVGLILYNKESVTGKKKQVKKITVLIWNNFGQFVFLCCKVKHMQSLGILGNKNVANNKVTQQKGNPKHNLV